MSILHRVARRTRIAALAAAFVAATGAATGAAPEAAPRMAATEASAHPLAGRIVDVATGRTLPGPAALAAALTEADAIFLGEVHDNAEHHAAQAWTTAAIGPRGLAFEMIRPSDEARLADLRAEGAEDATLAAALDWEGRGWPDFALYAPILAAAPGAVVTGAEVPRDRLIEAMRAGAGAAATGALGPAGTSYGLGDPLDPAALASATAEQVAAHCGAIPEEAARGMVEAQRLRDAAVADAALRALAAAGDGPVVVVAGAGHARRAAAPAALAVARPDLRTLSLGLVETAEGREDWRAYLPGGAPPFDYLWFTAPQPREDPCRAFRNERRL